MVYPFVANKVEQLELDPTKKIDGYVWYNTVEKVYKTWVGDEIHIFVTDASFASNVDEMVQASLDTKQFSFSFEEAYSVNVKHNRNSESFTYTVFNTIDKKQVNVQVEIVSENEVKIEFIDSLTGKLFMYFE